jgi:CTP synthase (UTP-ammonia lyase)
MNSFRVGLIGDYNPEVPAHRAIPHALELAARSSKVGLEPVWLGTDKIVPGQAEVLSTFAGLWCVPASPYANIDGALAAIRYARENAIPFLGTCGGFQHALIEYARDVAGLREADHAETNPGAVMPVITPLACSLVEKEDIILLQESSRIRHIYGRAEVTEPYRCRFGLNRSYEPALDDGRLSFTGRDSSGEARVFELRSHPFFIGTLFQPERSALRGVTHPLIVAYVQAVLGRPAPAAWVRSSLKP